MTEQKKSDTIIGLTWSQVVSWFILFGMMLGGYANIKSDIAELQLKSDFKEQKLLILDRNMLMLQDATGKNIENARKENREDFQIVFKKIDDIAKKGIK